MKISGIQELLDAKIFCCEENLGKHVYSAFASDMMSDVLAIVKDQPVPITGLINPQVVRTAEMMDMVCIVFTRGKVPSEHMIDLAKDSGIVLLSTVKTQYETSGILYANNLKGGAENV